MNYPDEPLVLSAPLALHMAASLCTGIGGQSCAWHHGFWQVLRIMGLATGPGHRADFYRSAFSKVASFSGMPRILISGTADYAMLAHVLAALHADSRTAEVTVIDLCETPLALNRWYAERAGVTIETRRCNALDFADEKSFDMVCTDGFLGEIEPALRPMLIAQWRRLLRPGGIAIAANRLRPGSDGKQTGFTEDQVDAFVERVRQAAVGMPDGLDVGPEKWAASAQTYGRKMRSWPVRNLDEIARLFENNGFKVEISVAPNPQSEAAGAATGPTMPGNAPYAQIIATRL